MHTVKLSKKYLFESGEKDEIELRTPTGRDYIAMERSPIVYKADGSIGNDYALMFKWAAHLSGEKMVFMEDFVNEDVDRLNAAIMNVLSDGKTGGSGN